MLAFAADAGSLAALGSQDVGVAGVGVAPAQVVLQLAGQHGVIGVVRAAAFGWRPLLKTLIVAKN